MTALPGIRGAVFVPASGGRRRRSPCARGGAGREGRFPGGKRKKKFPKWWKNRKIYVIMPLASFLSKKKGNEEEEYEQLPGQAGAAFSGRGADDGSCRRLCGGRG